MPQLFSAEWVLPVASAPVPDGVVAIEGARIAWVGPRRDLPTRFLRARVRAFPGSLLLPGWVNAHSHLNLTGALGRLPGSADEFAEWIRSVIRFQAALPAELVRQSIAAGLDLLAASGTTTAAHCAALPELEPFLAHPMRAVVFHEAIGFPEERAPALLAEAEEWLDAADALIADAGSSRVTLGLAPHAPYSVSAGLIRSLARMAERRGLPLSIHVAETRAEEEFLRGGAGQLRELLEQRGAWDAGWSPPGVSPVRYLADLGVLARGGQRRGAAVHCNYLSDADVGILAEGGLTPVWCPGSHHFFGHPGHPAGELLAAGVPVGLGTDSLASNAGLNMLREARLAERACPEAGRAAWLRAATLDAAAALGLDALTGSLEAGKAADIQVLSARAETIKDPLAALFEEDLRVRCVLVDGLEMKIR